MVIGTHPDDVELGMGGSVRRLILEGEVIIWVEMTTGVYTNINGVPIRTREEIDESRKKSLKLYRIPQSQFFCMEQPTTAMVSNAQTISELQKLMKEFEITDVYTHPAHDTYHQDHTVTHQIVMAAARRYVKNIYCWESVFNYAEGLFIPNLYIDISHTLDTKTESMAIHQTEYAKFGGFKLLDQITTLAKYRGSQCGCEYAEAFLTLKEVR